MDGGSSQIYFSHLKKATRPPSVGLLMLLCDFGEFTLKTEVRPEPPEFCRVKLLFLSKESGGCGQNDVTALVCENIVNMVSN